MLAVQYRHCSPGHVGSILTDISAKNSPGSAWFDQDGNPTWGDQISEPISGPSKLPVPPITTIEVAKEVQSGRLKGALVRRRFGYTERGNDIEAVLQDQLISDHFELLD